MTSSADRPVRFDFINPPPEVLEDPAVGQRWTNLMRRVMLRWLLVLGACLLVPYGLIALLTFRAALMPEPVAFITMGVLVPVAIVVTLRMRRWERRLIDEFIARELSGPRAAPGTVDA